MKDYQKFISFIVFFVCSFYWIDSKINIPYLSAGIISVVIFTFFMIWDKYLWKVKIFFLPNLASLVGLYNYPNISGLWHAEYSSSYNFDEKNNTYRSRGSGKIEITQSYSSLHIKADFGTSSNSESFSATLKQKDNGSWFVIYGYCNDPKDPQIKQSLNGGMHYGFAYLDIKKNPLEGYYTNDENRKTRGRLVLSKNPHNNLSPTSTP